MNDLLRDIRHALRLILRERTFSGTVLLTLAICLGANAAIYGVVHRVLLEPLPVYEADRVVTVYNSYPGAGAERGGNGSFDYFQRREHVPVFETVALYQGSGNTIGEAGSTQQVSSMRVTASFLGLMGVSPALGRGFAEEEMDPGNGDKVILTHGFWQEHFAEDPGAVGRELRVDGRPFTVVGILPEEFSTMFAPDARFLLPIVFDEEARGIDAWHSNNYEMLARLESGATVEQAVAQNEVLNDRLIDGWPMANARQLLTDVGYHTVVVPTAADMVRDVSRLLYMLWAGVGFVLMIGCVNIANLMLARAQTRVAEVATQLALGARRARVARQLFTESLVMGLLGAVLGVSLGVVGLGLLQRLGTSQLPRGTEISMDGSVVGFTLLLGLAAGTAFGTIPMVQIFRGDLSPVFRAGGRTGTASRRAVLLRNSMVTTQVALAFVMLVGAGLMLMSFRAAQSVDPGFRPNGVLTAFVSLPTTRYENGDARRRFWDEMLEQVRATPGVEAASLTSLLPFTGNNSSSVIFPEGYEFAEAESLLSPLQAVAGPGYFAAMGIDVLEGRPFAESDGPGTQRVIVLDEWLARRYFPAGNAIGSRMVANAVPGQDSIPEENYYTIVGVVRTVKQHDLTSPADEHVGAYYFSYRQQPRAYVALAVRATNGRAEDLASPLREILATLDPELPLFGVRTMPDRISESLLQRRTPLVLLAIFAGVALFLAMIGIYGALAYNVAQRTREIGIRMAIGSAPQDIFRSVVSQGLRATAVGLGAGLVVALALARLVQSLLFDVQATDPLLLVASAAVLTVVAVFACTLPARRATSINPVDALLG